MWTKHLSRGKKKDQMINYFQMVQDLDEFIIEFYQISKSQTMLTRGQRKY